MDDENLGKLLNELGEQTAESVRPGLAEDIKQCIPSGLMPHRGGMDTINIIVDLRVSKLVAAAVIIITMILLANLHGVYQDSKLLASYLLGGAGRSNVSAAKGRREYLVRQGKDVVFYDGIDEKDSNSIWMHWKVSDGKYVVVFGDLREKEVSADELIKLQAWMLQEKRE
ncbi:MAG: hypothetical protein ACYS9T_10705 [Planctomycetota bacterium]|jgi:hypothetical protein